MCGTCGCGEARVETSSLVQIERSVLGRNDALAQRNRAWLAERSILAVNVLSSPGSGKTTLLERTVRDLGAELSISVIEGDQATDNDAARIRAAGARAVQVNTGTGCHLDASMVERALGELGPEPGSIVFIENVGNLVCPALFDLGEAVRVVVASVTEGEDKPIKYPHMFRAADVIVLNKTDLAPHTDWDAERFLACVQAVNAKALVLPLSARTGEGLARFYDWLRQAARRGFSPELSPERSTPERSSPESRAESRPRRGRG